MATDELLRAALALAIGFLLGSVLPADLLARARGIDIRSVGDGNPGTVNAFRGLGLAFGLVTAAYDLSVGVVAVWFAHLLGVSEGVMYLAGVVAVVGHRFPVFRGFRNGGQGMAASAGLLVYGIAVAVSRGLLSAADIGALIAILLVTFALTRSDRVAAVVMLPVLVGRVILARPNLQLLAFIVVVAANIWIVQVAALRGKLHVREAKPEARV